MCTFCYICMGIGYISFSFLLLVVNWKMEITIKRAFYPGNHLLRVLWLKLPFSLRTSGSCATARINLIPWYCCRCHYINSELYYIILHWYPIILNVLLIWDGQKESTQSPQRMNSLQFLLWISGIPFIVLRSFQILCNWPPEYSMFSF